MNPEELKNASPAPTASDPQQEHDEAVHWLLCLRLTGCAIGSASPQFESNWEKDRQALLSAIGRGEQSHGATVEEIIQRAARLTEEEYAQDRDWIADAADIRVKDLDEFVAKRRPKPEEVVLNRVAARIRDADPWPEPVDGVALMNEIAATLRRFIIFEHRYDADMVAAWAVGTHCFRLFRIFPRLGITSPEKECGKSTVLDALEMLVARSILSSSLTPAVLYRIIEKEHPTLLVDELDTFIDKYPELDGVFNAGHKAGAVVMRCEVINNAQVVCQFDTFAPLAYGRIGFPKGTLSGRSLRLHMLRKDRSQQTEDLNVFERPALAELFDRLKRQITRWCLDNQHKIREQRPDTSNLANRLGDNWRPLLQITSVVGGGWLDKMYAAAGEEPPKSLDDDSDAVRLLRDIRNIFYTRGNVKSLTTKKLIADLLLQRESGWCHYRQEREPLSDRNLGKLLGHFQIGSKNLSVGPGQMKLVNTDEKRVQVRGYYLEQFAVMFAKFLQGEEPETVDVTG